MTTAQTPRVARKTICSCLQQCFSSQFGMLYNSRKNKNLFKLVFSGQKGSRIIFSQVGVSAKLLKVTLFLLFCFQLEK